MCGRSRDGNVSFGKGSNKNCVTRCKIEDQVISEEDKIVGYLHHVLVILLAKFNHFTTADLPGSQSSQRGIFSSVADILNTDYLAKKGSIISARSL